ncbi:uncharacterized protein [Asterias amurensis]|uniref:uncharacterized protein n=1 Tax=Asterias amurensis TaxID=7602 RepID=UPI003AB61EC2
MITLPALQSWLGHELETRGIDAVIYTRYILSILQQDGFEPETDCDRFIPKKDVRSAKAKGHQYKFRKSWTADDWKKYAVLECLQAVTEKDCGIESLVEELCVKLKRVKEERDRGTKDGVGSSEDDPSSSMKPTTKLARQENPATQAAKYYQAFPALSDKTNTMLMSESKPQGAWGAKKSPDGQHAKDRRVTKSVSASTSRGSRSPTRKHQRAKSLPNSVSHRVESPVFVVPKYHTKKGSGRKEADGGRPLAPRSRDRKGKIGERVCIVTRQASQSSQQHWQASDQPNHLDASPTQVPEFEEDFEDVVVDEKEISWYTEPVVAVLDQGKHLSKLQTVYKSDPSSPSVKTPSSENSLDEAVSSLAESLCRNIFEDDVYKSVENLSSCGLMQAGLTPEGPGGSPCVAPQDTTVQGILEGDSAERGRHGDKPDLLPLLDSCMFDQYASQGRNTSALQAMPLLVVDSQTSLGRLQGLPNEDQEVDGIPKQTSASAKQEYWRQDEVLATDLIGGACNLSSIWDQDVQPPKEPWERSPLKMPSSVWEDNKSINEGESLDQGINSPAELRGSNQDLPEALRVLVDHGKVARGPIGSAREEGSLLRICSPTHSHHQCSTTSALSSEFRPGNFSFSEEAFSHDTSLPSPNSVLSCCSDTGSPFFSESEQDSLAKGIKSAYNLDESTPTADDTQHFDINSALWSTYDAQPRYPHLPKIVRWNDGIFQRDAVFRRRKNSFIEGGVYGSPYSSQNNSHYNSCSTSPCESSSLRDLWNPSSVQEVSSLVSSMQELITSESGSKAQLSESRLSDCSSRRSNMTPEMMLDSSQQDEQSLIEDSLMDSPVFICSRSSSRFEFARSVSDLDGSLSPGTETDEMVSEAELLEEALKDVGEMDETYKCNKKEGGGDQITKEEGESSDSHKQSFPTDGSSQELTPSWMTPPHQGGAAGFSDDLCSDKSQGSLSLTGIVPSISKPEAVRKGLLNFDLAVGGSSPKRQQTPEVDGSLDLLISPKTHFRPIHATISPDNSSGDEVPGKDLNRTRGLLDSSHVGSFGDSHVSKVVGSAPHKSPQLISGEQWSWSEPSNFQGGSPNLGGRLDDVSCVKGQFHGHKPKYENLSWVSGQRRDVTIKAVGENGPKDALCGAEFKPSVNLDYEGQIFPFDDEAFLQGEGLSDSDSSNLKPLYSSDLEEKWLREAAGDANQSRPPWRKHRRKAAIRKKPCSFFLEGKCRRTECPFAHDVSGITCRFWEEEQCFKGEECPFLHGYPSKIPSKDRSVVFETNLGEEGSPQNTDRDGLETSLHLEQMNPASPITASEGAIPIPTNSCNSAKYGQEASNSSPRHPRSLPIRITKRR